MVEEEQRGVMVIYSVPVGYEGYEGIKLIDNARRPGRGSMMCPTINEESDCLRKKIVILLRRSHTILGGGQGKWALWQFCPTTEESLKNALIINSYSQLVGRTSAVNPPPRLATEVISMQA
jgi:hypothetical protein